MKSTFKPSKQNKYGRRNLKYFKTFENINKKKATVTKKTLKNLTENKLENVIGNMVDKTFIEFYPHSKSYIVSGFTDDIVLDEQTQETDEDATQTPSQDNENVIEGTQLQDERYEVTRKR